MHTLTENVGIELSDFAIRLVDLQDVEKSEEELDAALAAKVRVQFAQRYTNVNRSQIQPARSHMPTSSSITALTCRFSCGVLTNAMTNSQLTFGCRGCPRYDNAMVGCVPDSAS